MIGKLIYDELPKGILNWYDFREDASILYIHTVEDSISTYLREQGSNFVRVDVVEPIKDNFLETYNGFFDYIVIINQVEKIQELADYLSIIRGLLNDRGTLLIGMDNRFGLRYFCGDRDPFTHRNFDGIENYRKIYDQFGKHVKGKTYSKFEIENILDASGYNHRKFYTVLPNINFPQLIYAENVMPKEELGMRVFPKYNFPDTVFLEEQFLYTDIINNGLFHQMANGYLVECSLTNAFCNVDSVTLSLDRGKENALITKSRENAEVEKKWVYDEGKPRIERLYNNTQELIKRGINVIEIQLKADGCRMDYCEGESALTMFRNLLIKEPSKFEELLEKFIELIYKSSSYSIENEEVILHNGYIDMIPINCFYLDNEFIFFDQEFCIENYPIKGIIYRIIEVIYMDDLDKESPMSKQYLLKKYGLYENVKYWKNLTVEFLMNIRNTTELSPLLEKYSVNSQVLNTNRQKMNYPLEEYRNRFINIFETVEDKDVIIFGTGVIASRFIAQSKNRLNVVCMVDNNSNKWGQKLEGIDITSPQNIHHFDKNRRKIIICIKNYLPIVWQLENMGVKDYLIYDRNIEYPRVEKTHVVPTLKHIDENKPYKIGYISGVFDLFHVGHLNLLKKAKEQCEHLIVGVVTDEGVRLFKKTEPFIPLIERMEILQSCRYVDEVVEIPLYFSGARDAYNIYQFDCMFSGSDYEKDPNWLADREYLRKKGAEMVFLPYTETTSSSKIKFKINKSFE